MTTPTSRVKSRLAAAALLAVLAAPAPAAPDPGTMDALDAQARAAAAAQLQRLGQGYEVRIDPTRRLVFVHALDAEHFRQTAGVLARFSDAIRASLDIQAPASNVMIVLPTAEDYERLRPNDQVVGFYTPADRTLISLDRGRVLVHEFTHALHHADSSAAGQQHPVWIWEGLATLCDASSLSPDGTLEPKVDSRLLTLQKAIRTDDLIPLEKLMAMSPKAFMRDAELCYAEVRYLMLYLHEQGKLQAWYEAYKAGFDEDSTGKAALEKALRQRLYAIEEDWIDWAKELRLPFGESQAGQARLGLGVRDTSAGVKVISLTPGSAAETAGRILVGDVLLKFNGHDVSNSAELIGAIQAAGANQTVTVTLKRHGRPMTVQQPLGAPTQP